ncbi:L-aminoadipate-semialdehyde dehydrogenase [Mycena sanguinolenta]|uniref:L-aminoadipate-semialdehyde dehydrogenase n=1 Tax=Mycena sanguinolenta TaxID=230812 RepID=A0A8H7CMY7_9AGAR|nr:L-aminoadipate-semialdehyde dehydrogenase [Mycena sanguinolenta]
MDGSSNLPSNARWPVLVCPNEIWLETFIHLPRKTLMSLHAVSRLFHQISRPPLFEELNVHPFQVQEGASSRYSGPHDIERSMKRLEFWTSPAIAPFVRICTFSAFLQRTQTRHDPAPIFAKFFRLLPNLSNLKRFGCVGVKFDRAAVEGLCALVNLTQVQLTGCSLQLGEEDLDLTLRVKSFSCANTGGNTLATGAHRWLNILDRDTLLDLSLPSAPILLQETSSEFLHVQRLLIGFREWAEVLLLSKFPAVRSLKISWSPSYSSDAVQPRPVLFTQLDTYDGPHEILLFVDPLAAPRCLNIMPSDPQLLFERLLVLRPVLRAVEQLVLSLHYLRPDVLGGCLASFPILRELRLKIYHIYDDTSTPDGEVHTRQTFYDSFALSSPFPTTLEKLYISWPARTPPCPPLTLASAQSAKDALVQSTNSALKCIWLAALEFEYLWIRRAMTEDTDHEYTRTSQTAGGRAWLESTMHLELRFLEPQDPFVLRYMST